MNLTRKAFSLTQSNINFATNAFSIRHSYTMYEPQVKARKVFLNYVYEPQARKKL